MGKFGRNELCPCGSGRKYKKCCIDLNPGDFPLPGPRQPEDFAIGGLRQASPQFEAFYQVERSRIARRPLAWILSRVVPEGVKAVATVTRTGSQWIQLREMPAPVDAAQVVAHEMMHLVLWSEGFPLVIGPREAESVTALINTTFHDPLVEERLASYDFDPWIDFEQVQRRSLVELGSDDPVTTTAPAALEELYWGLKYAGAVLDYRVAVAARSNPEPNELRAALDTLSPTLATCGLRILGLVDSLGFDTPDKMERLLQTLLEQYQLAGPFDVHHFA